MTMNFWSFFPATGTGARLPVPTVEDEPAAREEATQDRRMYQDGELPVGTVVLDNLGDAWQLQDHHKHSGLDRWAHAGDELDVSCRTLEAVFGPLIVLAPAPDERVDTVVRYEVPAGVETLHVVARQPVKITCNDDFIHRHGR